MVVQPYLYSVSNNNCNTLVERLVYKKEKKEIYVHVDALRLLGSTLLPSSTTLILAVPMAGNYYCTYECGAKGGECGAKVDEFRTVMCT